MLLGNPRSNLFELDILSNFCNNAEGLSTIAAGLAGNTTFQILSLLGYGEVDLSPIAKALCNTSSIEGIHVSNHTLQKLSTWDMPTLPKMIKACLKLNKNTNKDEEIIRKKISRYYFVGKFSISLFAKMPVSVLPEVLRLIKLDKTISYRQSLEY